MICRWCREPLHTVEEVRQQALRPLLPRFSPLSRTRPPGLVVRCLPGLCEPYGFQPPGETPRCRHCGAAETMKAEG